MACSRHIALDLRLDQVENGFGLAQQRSKPSCLSISSALDTVPSAQVRKRATETTIVPQLDSYHCIAVEVVLVGII